MEKSRKSGITENPEKTHQTAKYKYKCRNCGALFFDGLESSVEVASRTLQDICIFGKDPLLSHQGMAVPMMRPHGECFGEWGKGRAEGVADLVGYEVEI
jgi:hypothetical protein